MWNAIERLKAADTPGAGRPLPRVHKSVRQRAVMGRGGALVAVEGPIGDLSV